MGHNWAEWKKKYYKEYLKGGKYYRYKIYSKPSRGKECDICGKPSKKKECPLCKEESKGVERELRKYNKYLHTKGRRVTTFGIDNYYNTFI